MVEQIDVIVNVYKRESVGGLLRLKAQNEGRLCNLLSIYRLGELERFRVEVTNVTMA